VNQEITSTGRGQPGEPITLVVSCARPTALSLLPQSAFEGYALARPSFGVDAAPVLADPLDIFRRAIVEGDQEAWGAIYTKYQRLVGSWLRRHAAAALAGEADDYLINRTFERFWTYVKPERFDSFAGLPALLQYLKLCAHGVLLDEARAQARKQVVHGGDFAQPSGIEEVGEREAAGMLWQAVSAEARDEPERLIAMYSFIHGLKPREIYERHPEQYVSIAEVYRIRMLWA
jgi:DNA-directed RNA polymerase specialized sigma24 family protein